MIEREFGVDVALSPLGEDVDGLCVHGEGLAMIVASAAQDQRIGLSPIAALLDRDDDDTLLARRHGLRRLRSGGAGHVSKAPPARPTLWIPDTSWLITLAGRGRS